MYTRFNLFLNKTSDHSVSLWQRPYSYFAGSKPYTNMPHLPGHFLYGQSANMIAEGFGLETIMKAGELARKSNGMCSFWYDDKVIVLLESPALINEYKSQLYDSVVDHPIPGWEEAYPGYGSASEKVHGFFNNRAQRGFITKNISTIRAQATTLIDDSIASLYKNHEGEIHDASHFFRTLSVKLAAKIFMGLDDFNNDESAAALATYIEKLVNVDPALIHVVWGFKQHAGESDELKAFKAARIAELKQLLLDKHLETLLKNNSLLHSLLENAIRHSPEKEATDELLFAETFFFFCGGPTFTTADVIPLTLQMLSTHPDIKEKLTHEIRKMYEEGKSLNEIATDKDSYLEMFISEALRYRTPIPTIPLRELKQDIVLNGVTLKKGDIILIAPHLNHHDPKIWGENHNEFIPERFSANNRKNIPTGAFIPFGLGTRNCPGNLYARVILKMILCKMLHENKLEFLSTSEKLNDAGITVTTNDLKIKLTSTTPSAFAAKHGL